MIFDKINLSVIIPTFNRLKYLQNTLTCLMNQRTGVLYEIIIIDSGNDATEQYVQSLKKQKRDLLVYKKIKNSKNRSLLRNKGAKIAKGDILVFLDNDILVAPNFIEQIYQKQDNNCVLMGRRKSLIDLSSAKYLKKILLQDFSLLDKLPWYEDERTILNTDFEPWRFIFSHTLCMKKELFENLNGFDKRFGEQWGFEDLELGFRIQQKNYKILYDKNIISYHQPHLSQSNKEQHTTLPNQYLFIKLHNCFQVELYVGFYLIFENYGEKLIDIKNQYQNPPEKYLKQFDLVLGCIFDSKENRRYKNRQLGILIPRKNHSCNKVLILSTIFDFDSKIQMAITCEALRVSKKIYFEETKNCNEDSIKKLFKLNGYKVTVTTQNNTYYVIPIERKLGNIYSILLPDCTNPEKRFVQLWLSKKLEENGKFLVLRDQRNIRDLRKEDFSLSEPDLIKLNNYTSGGYNIANYNFISSATMLNENPIIKQTNGSEHFILDDLDLKNKYGIDDLPEYYRSSHVNKYSYAYLSFAACFDYLNDLDKLNKTPEKYDYICFMENGFIDDSIESIINAFNNSNQEKECYLLIKSMDYEKQSKNAYPLHNKASKQSKLLYLFENKRNDENLLYKSLTKGNSRKKTTIINENLSFFDISNLISESNCLICVGKGITCPPQIYIAILLGKKILLSDNYYLPPEMEDYVIRVKVHEMSMAKAYCFPENSNSLAYVSCLADEKDLENKMTNKYKCKNKLNYKDALIFFKLFEGILNSIISNSN